MDARARVHSRSAVGWFAASSIGLACSSLAATTVDEVQQAMGQVNVAVEQVVVQASILSELLRTREAAGEMNPAEHARNVGAAVSQLRSAPETMPVAFLKRERVAAAQRLIAAAESQIAVARWPTDRPGPYYVQLSRLAMDDARVRLAYLSGLDASLVEASRRAAEVIGWTQGRLDGGRVFDGLDEETEAMTKAVVTQLPRPPMPSSTVAAAPGAAGSPRSPNPTQTGSTPAAPTSSARPGREVTIADPMARGYRLDRCLHWGQQCEEPAATAWCRTQGYQRATHWQWRYVRPTLVMGDNLVCDGDYCGAFTTITCSDQPDATQPQPATATPGGVPSAPPPQTPQQGTQAGVPIHGNPGFGSWQVGMDIYDGADYRNFPIPNSDPAVCLAECARDARCRAVTYTMPGTYGSSQAACWLKAQTGRFGPHASAISAVKIGTAAAGGTPPPIATPPVVTPPVATKPPPALCDIGGQWRMDTQNVGQSTWTFSPLGGGRYSGQESGLGNASGTASVNGNSLHLEWRSGSYSGIVELTLDASCSSGQGRQVFYTGSTGSEVSRWTRVGATPPPVATKPPSVATPPVAATAGGLTGKWNGPLGVYEMVQTGNNFTWRVGNEIGQGTLLTGDDLSVTWTGGGSATGKITERTPKTPQGLPIEILWSNGVRFRRVGS